MQGSFRGRRNPASKLTETLVQTIRARYEAGDTQGQLARLYGVSINTIGRIVRGETWNWLEEQPAADSLPPLAPELQEQLNAQAKRLLAKLIGEQQHENAESAEPRAGSIRTTADGRREGWDAISKRWVKLPY